MKMLPLFCGLIITLHHSGKRKPSPEFYLQALDQLNVDPASCIFIDDRLVFVDAALVLFYQCCVFLNMFVFLPLQDVKR
jgi:HAD superfamily hydrolase (TIGR01509 family)